MKMTKKILSLVFAVLTFVSLTKGQKAEVTVSLNEQFFDSLLDAMFKNFNAPEFPLARTSSESKTQSPKPSVLSFSESITPIQNPKSKIQNCNETIRLQREVEGVRTAVRFRDGKIYTPLAFSGSYNPPLIGCVEFQGFAETNIDLEYDKQTQKLVGRVRVLNVQLSGTGGIGGSLIAKLVQSSIDKKINPIEILQADKLSFVVPIKNANASLRMKATGIRYEVTNGALNVHIAYEFVKA
jgi:hypothetical protein